ncbi:MAG: site-specific integrase [Sphingobacterium sp.]|nr:site-specific integrase [Sphingobacterium sp.]
MKSNQKLLIMFWLRKGKTTKKSGTAPLYARVTIDGEDEDISVSLKIAPEYWDTESKKVTDPTTEGRKANLEIAQAEIDLDRFFTVLQSQHERVTPLMLKKAYLEYRHPSKKIVAPTAVDHTLLKQFDLFIEKFDKQVEKGLRSNETLKHWRTARSKAELFINRHYQLADISLSEIQFSFAEEFHDFHTLFADHTISEITSRGYLKKTKQILTGCSNRNLIPKNPLAGYCCTVKEKEIIPLEMFEVQQILNKELPINRLSEVRDAFIFQIFTGFAFQDLYGLTPDNIVFVGQKGERWLIKDRGKTGVVEKVPVLPIVDELIDKYKNHLYCKSNNVLMPVNSNERYNGYLKEIAVICGIKRDLNTHLARHTFAHLMLEAGVPLEDVSKMLGHKDLRTTKRYCRVQNSRVSENMELARQKLFLETGQLRKVG